MTSFFPRLTALSYLFLFLPLAAQNAVTAASRERVNFDAGWRFHLGDPDDVSKGQLDYGKLKDFMLATGNDLRKNRPSHDRALIRVATSRS